MTSKLKRKCFGGGREEKWEQNGRQAEVWG